MRRCACGAVPRASCRRPRRRRRHSPLATTTSCWLLGYDSADVSKMKIALCTFVISIFLVNYATPENACAKSAILELAGDATITGLFNIHKGPNCSEGDPTGLQQMTAAAWIVNTLNQNNFLPGIKIGIDLYDACTTDLDELMKSFTNENCKKSYNLGLLTIPELEQNLLSATNSNETLIFFTDSQSPKQLLIDTTVNVLVSLNWTKVDYLFAPSEAFLYTFNKRSYHNGICIVKQHVLPDFQNVHWKHLLHRAVLMERNNTLIVLFGTWEQMLSVVEALAVLNSSIQWILVPFDTMTQRSDIENAPRNSLVVLPAIGILQEKKIHEDMNLAHDHQMYNATGQSEKRIFINYPLFMNVAFPVLNILTKFKAAVSEYCTPDSADYICSTLSSVYFNYSSEPPKRDFIMKMILSSDYIIVTAISHIGENNNLEDFAIYEESPEHEETPIKIVSENYNDVFQGDFCNIAGNNGSLFNDCSYCSNFAGEQVVIGDKMGNFDQVYQLMSWRPEAWVAAVTSIGAVGITCALAITIFISVRICKGDILEGNPFFSYLLLLSVIFTYLSTLPFSFKYDDHDEYLSNLFCALRITGTSMSYAFLFSIMLSRSLMLASFDNDGPFMSHINGFMQSILCIFILGVQIALSVQFLIIRTNFLNAEKCTSMYEGYNFQILLCYDVFLLLLLVCTSPFSVRSKRNYSEGMFFTVASFICMLIWISWTAAYLILPREWKDVAISGGLAATATGILVTVFIPRTYLMLTAIVRDNLTSALPSLACTNSTSILDLNYRTTSNQVLYDCVNPFPGGQLNPNFYSEQPQAISVVKPEDIDPITPEGTYEMYDSPTSPNKVTHF